MNNLQPFHTFGIKSRAKEIYLISDLEKLKNIFKISQQQKQPFLFIGEGSNMLFTQDFEGVVAVNQLKGINHCEDNDFHYLYIQGGENWHQLVKWSVENHIGGLENLALIPGCCGSAPIQNIGAYGVEFKDVCDYVEVLNLKTNEIFRLMKDECHFGYRESIFKHQYKENFIIIAVGLKLKKDWNPHLNYGELREYNPQTVTPKMIFDKICEIRQQKLPNPKMMGNAGSFFKNPVINKKDFENLQKDFPQMPFYPQGEDQIKLPAGWLIDQCGLKGFQIGGAKVHTDQALVLVNTGNATARDVMKLASHVRHTVAEKFKVWIEPEVRFMGVKGEINAVEALDSLK